MGTKLSEVMEAGGRRYTWLAAQTGVDVSTAWRYAKGERTPTPEFRVRAAKALGMDEDELFPEIVPAA